jgi:cytosine/uracil/thiamine/allantoin permease
MLTPNWLLNTTAGAMTFVHFFPKSVSFRTGCLLTCIASLIIYCTLPIFVSAISSASGVSLSIASFFGALSILAVFISPVVGILIVDYYLINKGSLDVEELPSTSIAVT